MIRRGWQQMRYSSVPYLVMLVFTVLFYFPLVLPGMGNLTVNDFAVFHVPFRIYASMELGAGDLPLRTNAIWGGYPLYQDIQFAIWYPVNLLSGLLVDNFEREWVVDLYVLVNLVLFSLSAVYLMRSAGLGRFASVTGAAVACFNGFMVTFLVYLNLLQATTMSLFAAGLLLRYGRGLASDGRLVLGAGVMMAFANLAGHPQTMVYYHYALAVGVALLSFWVWERTGLFRGGVRMALGGVVALGLGIVLAAVQLIPSAHLIAITPRASVDMAEVLWSAVELPQLFMLLFPGFYVMLPWHLEWPVYYKNLGPEAVYPYFEFTNITEGYIALGLFGVVLGLVGWWQYRRVWMVQALGWGSVFVLLCGMGDLPFYGWLCKVLPGVGLQRVATRILVVFFPAWGLLAGLGMECVLRGEGGVVKAGRWIAGLLVVAVGARVGWLYVAAEGFWPMAWVRSFLPEMQAVLDFDSMIAAKDTIYAALFTQIAWGVFFVVGMVVLFGVRIGRPRARGVAVAGMLGLELVLYSFGTSVVIQEPHIETVRSVELAALDGEPEGRVLLRPFTYDSRINSALYTGFEVANGYSVTVDKFVYYMLPLGAPPWHLGMHGVQCDLWNISDALFLRRPVHGRVGDGEMVVSDWGWSTIGPKPPAGIEPEPELTRKVMPDSLVMDFETSQGITGLTVLGFGADCAGMEDGVAVADVVVGLADGGELRRTLRLGREVSEATYPAGTYDDGSVPGHTSAPVSYRRVDRGHWSDGFAVNNIVLDVVTSGPVRDLRFDAVGPFPATFSVVGAVATLEDGSRLTRYGYEVEGFEEVVSRDGDYVALRRDVPGFVRMVPEAIGGSYKEIAFVLNRLVNGEIDPGRTLVVDKRVFDEEMLAGLNAENVEEFEGGAEIEWISEEEAVVRTWANDRGWLYLSYAWDGGWRVWVNGERVDVSRANGAFMGVPLGAGENVVEFRYRPRGLLAGGVVSGAGLVFLVGAWVWVRRRGGRKM